MLDYGGEAGILSLVASHREGSLQTRERVTMKLDEVDTLNDLKEWVKIKFPNGATVSEGEGGIVINTGLTSSMGGYLHPLEGECDKCASSYELNDKDNRCGNCGNCSGCCTHEREAE